MMLPDVEISAGWLLSVPVKPLSVTVTVASPFAVVSGTVWTAIRYGLASPSSSVTVVVVQALPPQL